MLLIINIKYFAVEEQLPVMLLISVIKILTVVSELKDLAKAAQGATDAPENVNVVGKATSDEQINDAKTEQVQTIDAIVKQICSDGHSHVVNTTITNIDCQERIAANGNSYLNAFITISNPVKGAQSMPDGTHRMGALGAIQTPFNQVLLVMRKDKFYGRFVNYIAEAAEAGFASMYLTGVNIRVLCQFVAAGVQERNPFTRKDNLYNVVDYDRYVYHIIGIEQPSDAVTAGAYNALIKQLMDDARAAIAAKREAKAKAASFVASSVSDDDIPF